MIMVWIRSDFDRIGIRSFDKIKSNPDLICKFFLTKIDQNLDYV